VVSFSFVLQLKSNLTTHGHLLHNILASAMSAANVHIFSDLIFNPDIIKNIALKRHINTA
jgi:hypothetical protein